MAITRSPFARSVTTGPRSQTAPHHNHRYHVEHSLNEIFHLAARLMRERDWAESYIRDDIAAAANRAPSQISSDDLEVVEEFITDMLFEGRHDLTAAQIKSTDDWHLFDLARSSGYFSDDVESEILVGLSMIGIYAQTYRIESVIYKATGPGDDDVEGGVCWHTVHANSRDEADGAVEEAIPSHLPEIADRLKLSMPVEYEVGTNGEQVGTTFESFADDPDVRLVDVRRE